MASALLPLFGDNSRTKIDYRKKGSNLSTGGPMVVVQTRVICTC